MALPRRALEDLALTFELRLLETASGHGDDRTEILAELAQLYSRLGRPDRSLPLDERLVRREPQNPVHHYNLACSLALLGRPDPAFAALRRALELGFDDLKLLLEDRDLQSLRRDPRWEEILRRARERS